MGSKSGIRLLRRAKGTKFGWTARDLRRLYKSFGFNIIKGAKHDIVKHPLLPSDNKTTLTRSSEEISPAYVEKAVELIERVLDLEKEVQHE